jgi:hypothetical protein
MYERSADNTPQVFKITATRKTPKILLNFEQGLLEVEGLSIPENPYRFYQPVLDAIDEYLLAPRKHTLVCIYLRYFNSATVAMLGQLFKRMEQLTQLEGHQVKIEWKIDDWDEDSQDVARLLNAITRLPFEVIPISDTDSTL